MCPAVQEVPRSRRDLAATAQGGRGGRSEERPEVGFQGGMQLLHRQQRARLDGTEGDARRRRDLPLGQAAVVRGLQHPALRCRERRELGAHPLSPLAVLDRFHSAGMLLRRPLVTDSFVGAVSHVAIAQRSMARLRTTRTTQVETEERAGS